MISCMFYLYSLFNVIILSDSVIRFLDNLAVGVGCDLFKASICSFRQIADKFICRKYILYAYDKD